jgi:hypothetical protein
VNIQKSWPKRNDGVAGAKAGSVLVAAGFNLRQFKRDGQ